MSADVGLLHEAAPEPPDSAYMLVGEFPVQVLYQRDDQEADRLDLDEYRWFVVADPEIDPVPWSKLAGRPHERMYLRGDLNTSMVEVLDARELAGVGS